MKCPTCGTINREDMKFCGVCGAPLSKVSKWFYEADQEPIGPLSREEMVQAFLDGKVHIETLV